MSNRSSYLTSSTIKPRTLFRRLPARGWAPTRRGGGSQARGQGKAEPEQARPSL